MKKVFALLLAATMTLSLFSACGSSSSDSTESSASESSSTESAAAEGETTDDGSDYKVLKVGITGAVDTLNPFATFTTGTWATLPAYYERLANYSEDNSELTPQLAKSWTQTSDYEYEVEIWDYIHDSELNPITADDIVFCYNTAKEGGLITGLDNLVSVEKIDDYKIKFTLDTKQIMAIEGVLASVDIVSQAAYEASEDNMASACVGTGRYIVQEFEPSSSMVLVKNTNYWQTDELSHFRSNNNGADEIHIITILEEAQLAVALQTGTIDAAKISTTNAGAFIDNDDYDDFLANSTAYYYLRFNVGTDSVFYNNVALRQAICYAINVDDIITGTYSGEAVEMKTIGLPNQTGYQEKWQDEEYYEYDLDKAKELMAEAGYADGLTINLVVLGNDICKSWSTIVQAQLSQIGITVNVEALDSAVWYTRCITGDFDICGFNINSPHVANNIAASVGAAQYYVDAETTPYLAEILEDEEMQALFVEATDVTTSSDEAIDEMHQMVKDKAYAYALAYPLQHTYVNKELNVASPGYAQNYVLVPSCFSFND